MKVGPTQHLVKYIGLLFYLRIIWIMRFVVATATLGLINTTLTSCLTSYWGLSNCNWICKNTNW